MTYMTSLLSKTAVSKNNFPVDIGL